MQEFVFRDHNLIRKLVITVFEIKSFKPVFVLHQQFLENDVKATFTYLISDLFKVQFNTFSLVFRNYLQFHMVNTGFRKHISLF